jgi:hypothetical protein
MLTIDSFFFNEESLQAREDLLSSMLLAVSNTDLKLGLFRWVFSATDLE